MQFVIKKFIAGLLLPLPFLLTTMGLSLFLLWFSQWQKTAKSCLTVSWLGLLLLSLQPIADYLLAPLENHYPTYQTENDVDFIVVLGGGYTYNPDWAPSSNLIDNSLYRVAEGVRIHLQNPSSKLVFTGGKAIGSPIANAKVAGLVAESLGVRPENIIVLDRGKDTAEEAKLVAKLIGNKSMALVTSANHLPRAIVWFEKEGLSPIPAPANQLAITTALNPWETIFPKAIYLAHSERAWYETLGNLWQRTIIRESDDNDS